MRCEDGLKLAIEAFQGPIGGYHSTLVTTADEVRSYLVTRQSTREARIARMSAELGPLAAGRIDAERFATLFGPNGEGTDPDTVAAVRQALGILTDLAERGDPVWRVAVPAGASLYDAVSRALAEIGRAFGAARRVAAIRAGRDGPGQEDDRPLEALPFSRWTRQERRLAPPLMVSVEGRDLRAGGLVEFLDGRQKIVLVVDGECAPAPLVRLVGPGTFVVQTNDGSHLERLAGWEGPGVAALVSDSAARFMYDPSAGPVTSDRFTIDHLPEKPPRRPIGGLSVAQQMEELELLRSLGSRPAKGGEPRARGAAGARMPAGGTPPADPADKLAAWLLSQADLSDLG